MTITTHTHQDGRKDARTDSATDVHTDADKAGRTDRQAPAPDAFVIVVANHKGGVTKTTSTANLGAMFAEAGRRVLIVDRDPQANLSELFGWVEELPGERLEDLLAHPATARYAPPPALQADVGPRVAWRDRLSIIPATGAPANVAADLAAAAEPGYELALRQVLKPLRPRFDLILLDTSPGLGTLSGMAMLAGDGLLIPALPADLDIRGAGKVYDLVEGDIADLRILVCCWPPPTAAGSRRARRRSEWRQTRCGYCRSASHVP